MAIDPKDLRRHVEQDHARASQLRSKASQARQAPMDSAGTLAPSDLAWIGLQAIAAVAYTAMTFVR